MSKCFGNDLGFSIFKVHSDLSKQTMLRLLHDLGRLKIPDTYGEHFRFFFYFFGHGNSKEICLTDDNLEGSIVVSEVQNIDRSLCKIVLFDCCRVEDEKSSEINPFEYDLELNVDVPMQERDDGAVKEFDGMANLQGGTQWKKKGQHPKSINTLVIYATEHRSEAYYYNSEKYPEMKGCGLVTHFFTQLASSQNESLSAVLTEVRQRVDSFIKENTNCPRRNYPQVLVHEDRLMENVNLLLESKGQERAKPKIVRIKHALFITTVQWVFRLNVDERIEKFRVVCRDELGQQIDILDEPTLKNVAEFKNECLKPKAKYYIKVLAVYRDGFESASEEQSFATLDLPCAQITCVELIRLFPPTLDVQRSIEDHTADSQPTKFRVSANGGSMPITQECTDTRTTLENMYYGTRYSLIVNTYYEGEVSVTSEGFHNTTPTKKCNLQALFRSPYCALFILLFICSAVLYIL